jgi:hypothetical protein
MLLSAFPHFASCSTDMTPCIAGPPERTLVADPSVSDRRLDCARVEAGRGNWKSAMSEVQGAFREHPESRDARALLDALAPRVWAEWESEISRRSEYSSCPAGISPESMAIRNDFRDGRRFESAGMLDEALEKFREAGVRMLLLPSDRFESSPQDSYRMAREKAIARLSSLDERKR